MPKEEEINLKVTPVEKRFIEFFRALQFGKVEIEIIKGEPVKAYRIIENHLFTIEGEQKRLLKDI